MTRRILGSFRKQPSEVLDYKIDYTNWLRSGELLSAAEAVSDDPALVISATYIDGAMKVVTYFASGGVSGAQYKVTITVETDQGQTMEREVNYYVEEL